jgi:predicted deacetylase
MHELDALAAALAARSRPVDVFFRDDDAGWGSDQLSTLCETMSEAGVDLDLAVIPAALEGSTAIHITRLARQFASILNFHQHGYAHCNHQAQGRSCEFGSDRNSEQQHRDISLGQERLQDVLGASLDPVFTPPWNRCSEATCKALAELEFRAISRIAGSVDINHFGLADISVAIDWQKKRRGVPLTWSGFCQYAQHHLLNSDVVGVMLHHEHLGGPDLSRLRSFIACLRDSGNVRFRSMLQILDSDCREQRGYQQCA